MMRRAAQQERSAFERRRRDRDWQLPFRGIHYSARDREIDGSYASELVNLWWDAGRLVQRPGYDLASTLIARQRITHALSGGDPTTITVFPSYVQAEGSSLARSTPGRMMMAAISNQSILVDGSGPPVRFNGTLLDVPEFTGADVAGFDGVLAHQDRLFFWRSSGPLEFWYGGLGAVEGDLARFPLDRLGNIEGGIAAMGRYSSDAGDNANDLLVIFTTEGHVVIYEGLDPGLTDSWRLWGRMKLAVPVTRFATLNYGPDLLVLTAQGIVSIGEALGRGSLAMANAMSEPVQLRLREMVAAAPSSPRWQMIADPSQRFVLVNTPFDGALAYTPSNGWAMWADLPALNWRRKGLDLRFTKNTGREVVFGGVDGDEGAPIKSTWWTPWTRSVGPHIATATPLIRCLGPLEATIAVLADHADTDRDIAEATQTVTIPVENATHAATQTIHERLMVGITGEALQMRLSFRAKDAEVVAVRWTG